MQDETAKIDLNKIVMEDGAHELASSPDMRPYVEYTIAELQGKDTMHAFDAIISMPLEKRYIWRVASALKWAFADFDDENVALDIRTVVFDDLARVSELIEKRPLQFCMFMRALIGPDEMERIMSKAISQAR